MGKSKTVRSLNKVGQAQKEVEKQNKDKFSETQGIAQGSIGKITASPGRLSPQISCTVSPEDKQLLNDLTIYAINRAGKPLNTSAIIRALIRLGHKRKDELEF